MRSRLKKERSISILTNSMGHTIEALEKDGHAMGACSRALASLASAVENDGQVP